MNMSMTNPIFYSFRRCPYAMRARLALNSSKLGVELREIILRDKPEHMLEVSPKGTVPVMLLPDGNVIDESLDVMLYALGKNDPEHLLDPNAVKFDDMLSLIAKFDGPFKTALDRYKYANRHENVDVNDEREIASKHLMELEALLVKGEGYLFGNRITLADLAILPFVRQFANVDKDWFDNQPWPNLIKALDSFVSSDRFLSIMEKYPRWKEGDQATYFGSAEVEK
ncbi:MAG: glutathione S-transferase [Lentilitoribacter sp.]